MESKIIVAMDVPDRKEAVELAKKLDPTLCRLKVGLQLFVAEGPRVVEDLKLLGFEIFLDLKFFDIPNTVKGAVRSACELGVWMTNVHCLGTSKMMLKTMEAAYEVINKIPNPPIIIGVTVLTSMNIDDLEEIGIPKEKYPEHLPVDYFTNAESKIAQAEFSTIPEVLRLGKLAMKAGLSGIVSSGQECRVSRKEFGSGFILVTPAIRLPSGKKDDQERIVTPEFAIQEGAHYLVVGRPISEAPDPLLALEDFNRRALSVSYKWQ